MDAPGAVRVPLDPASLGNRNRRLGEEAVEAIAICFLHSYRNPAHEEVAADAVRAALPGVFVSRVP